MANRKLKGILAPGAAHFVGDGFRVHNFIPSRPGLDMLHTDPFLMLDYNAPHYFAPTDQPRGVGVHPHKGFETVTIAYKGAVAHHDSSGGGGVIHPGDVQWMTAGAGVLHQEYHEANFARTGGDFHMVQLWVNLPAKDKQVKPGYQALTAAEMGRYPLPDGRGEVEVIAGNYAGTAGPAKTFTPIHLYHARLEAGGTANFSFPAAYNTFVLQIAGEVMLNNETTLPQDHLAALDHSGEEFTLSATTDTVSLIMSGAPIGEPIAAQGPFVMNTREELVEAFRDYQEGKFGQL